MSVQEYNSEWAIELCTDGSIVGVSLFGELIGCCLKAGITSSANPYAAKLNIEVLYSLKVNDWHVELDRGEVAELLFCKNEIPQLDSAKVESAENGPILHITATGPFDIHIAADTAQCAADITSVTDAKCCCGVAAIGGPSSGPQHSSYCPVRDQ